jgi:hypothetical protein
MDFAERQEAVAVAAVFDEGRLKRRLDPRNFREVDVAFKLFSRSGFVIEIFEAVAAQHDDPGLLRVAGVD